MRKIILSQEGCTRCKALASLCPDAEVVEMPVDKLLMFARELDIKSLPIVVIANAEPHELAEVLK